MGLSCGMKCLKYLLFAFNFVFWLLGIAVLAVGIWSRVDGGNWDTLIKDSSVASAANLMIASGVIVSLIGFLGCCGAVKKNQCMLVSYAIFIILIFILELAAGIYTYTKRETVQNSLEKNLMKGVNKIYGDKKDKASEAMTIAIDWVQKELDCCGAGKPQNWDKSNWYNNTKNKELVVPESCCVKREKDCNKDTAKNIVNLVNNKAIHSQGCVAAGKDFIKKHMWKIAGAAIGIAVVQLLGIVFALCLCCAIREEEKGTNA